MTTILSETPVARPKLVERAIILRALRGWLDARGWVEVQTPLLVEGTCPDVAVGSFEVGGAGYLVTSTEYQIKRLMAAGTDGAPGMPQVYTLGANFRPGDIGERHNPEFTMLEWARAGATMREVEAEAEGLIRGAWEALGRPEVRRGGAEIGIGAAWERRTVREVLSAVCGAPVGGFGLEALRGAVARGGRGLNVPEAFTGEAQDLVSWLLAEAEAGGALGGTGGGAPGGAQGGTARPVWLVEWPAYMTPSAARDPENPEVAIRSELFIAGLEIADGFPFLSDAALQERLFVEERARRARLGLPEVAADRRYLEALRRGLPPGAGMAMGVDRLCMILTGAAEIREVMAFAWGDR